jgi:ketosteroid isomerase-like protein
VAIIRQIAFKYLDAAGAGDFDAILSCFIEDATVALVTPVRTAQTIWSSHRR